MRKQIEKRIAELIEMGMVRVGMSFVGTEEHNKDFHFPMIDIQCDRDEVWNKNLDKAKAELKRRTKKD